MCISNWLSQKEFYVLVLNKVYFVGTYISGATIIQGIETVAVKSVVQCLQTVNWHILRNVSKTRTSCFIRGSKHGETAGESKRP